MSRKSVSIFTTFVSLVFFFGIILHIGSQLLDNLLDFTCSSSRLCRLNLEDDLEDEVNILPKKPEMLFLRAIAGEHTLWVSK